MRYVPSPIEFGFHCKYTATANQSGRMQYHKITPGASKERISRTEFIKVFNTSRILALNPLQLDEESTVFQLEFYT